jgi:hypothetical protein
MGSYITAHKLEVRDSPVHGRGVFAIEDIEENVVVEESHLVDSAVRIESVVLSHMMNNYFWATTDGERYLISLGLASVFNQSERPNLKFEYIVDENIYRFTTNRFINRDEELFIDYGGRETCHS